MQNGVLKGRTFAVGRFAALESLYVYQRELKDSPGEFVLPRKILQDSLRIPSMKRRRISWRRTPDASRSISVRLIQLSARA